jgi:hypothetical protein
MENLRQVVLGVSFFKKDVKGRSFVVAFNDLDEVHQYVPPQFIAHAWSGRNVLRQPLIVLAASSLDGDRRIVTHELTHVIAFNAIPDQPAWFAEGLAGYFETVRLDEHNATIDVGVPLDFRIQQLHDSGPTPTNVLFACEQAACKDDRFYATTWELLTYLLNEHGTELMQYMERLLQTPPAEQAQLWGQVFPQLPPAKLDHELATWLHNGKIRVSKYKIALRDWPVTERPVAEADVLAAKGALRYLFAPEAGTPSEISRSLALDSTNVIANVIEAAVKKSVGPEVGHAITAAHPDDWRAWWLAWRASQNGSEAHEAREKTCALLDANPAAVPIEECARDATGAFAEDPRRQVFMAATPQINSCMTKSTPADLGKDFSIEMDIVDSGAVTAARVSIGSAATNACVETVVKGLSFPPHHSGTFRMTGSRPGHP